MARELVSVVIPAYNQGQFVREAVLSALEQTYGPLEVIVIDDGSTDNTQQQLAPFLHRVRYVHQKNAGLSAARNTGIQLARGEWIALLDADDVWHRQKLEIQLAAIENRKDVALVGSPAITVLPLELPSAPCTYTLTVRHFLLSARMGPSSALIRRRSLEAVGMFDESLQSVEDRDMWLRIAAKLPCVLVESPCWWHREHPGQLSRNADRMFCNYRRVLRKFFDANPKYRTLRRLAMGYLHYDAAWCNFAEGRKAMALLSLARSASYRPLGLGDPRRPPLARSRLAARIFVDSIRQPAWRVKLRRRGSDDPQPLHVG